MSWEELWERIQIAAVDPATWLIAATSVAVALMLRGC